MLKTLCKASYPSGLARLYQSVIVLIQFVCYRSEALPSPYRKAIVNPAMTMLTMDISLMRMFSDGPEVSLNGSPTVSPTMVALWLSLPLPQKCPSSIIFLALSHVSKPNTPATPSTRPTTMGMTMARSDGIIISL